MKTQLTIEPAILEITGEWFNDFATEAPINYVYDISNYDISADISDSIDEDLL